jgi:predicted nucleic acid-binding protein
VVIAFFDASALIYLIEGNEPFARAARSTLRELATRHRQLGAAVSRLSWLECRVHPMKRRDHETLRRYDAFFARSDLLWLELSREVVELAAAIRVQHGLRTPDALQAASCLQLGPEHRMLTGDSSFRRVANLNVVQLS